MQEKFEDGRGNSMNFLEMFLGQDNSSYSLTMMIIYVVVIIAAFGLCVHISRKLKIYSHKGYKATTTTITTDN